jgi:hypothetical protein
MTPAKRVVLKGDPEADFEGGMEFRLTYAGPLHATQRDPLEGKPPKHTENRYAIRQVFHGQLKKLWETIPNRQKKADAYIYDHSVKEPLMSVESLAERHALYGFNFVPLVTEELDLICDLEILFLRPDRPGGVVWTGDIDNRLKTLLDAMRIPEAGEDYAARKPTEDQKPFFCLLEDDKLITKVAVETDRLLEPIGTGENAADSRLVITVRLRPFEITPFNLHFG